MNIIDLGTGIPVVLIPGAQGRWEWMRPSVDALAKRCRVITFSLADEPTSGASFDESAGIWSYVQQVSDVLERTGVRQATICGVSYGGLIATAFAARHPDKVSALVLMSAIPPSWRPDARQTFFHARRCSSRRSSVSRPCACATKYSLLGASSPASRSRHSTLEPFSRICSRPG
jgi:pimeloyl-ACP methyl ester carboxylesterase